MNATEVLDSTLKKFSRNFQFHRRDPNSERDFETLNQNDCTDSNDNNCRQIHAIIKQVTENDAENRDLQYLATSGYFVHDFEELNIKSCDKG